ncbi:MAG: ERCC4 domain-containing protein [Candidatus Hadarchaeales archaeon]
MSTLKIVADHRESSSGIIELLKELGAGVSIRQLQLGDFIVGEEVVVERKSADDFLQSLIDGRLHEQAKAMSENFRCPVLIIEGDDIYNRRKIHPNAIRGALAALAIDFRIPILWSRDERETAELLLALARRKQLKEEKPLPLRRKLGTADFQRFIVESLPGVSAVLARRLLDHFRTVEKIMCASEKELMEVEGIGKKKVAEIRKVLTQEYPSQLS